MVAVPARGFAASASPQCSVAAEPASAPAFSSTPLGVLAAAKNIAFGIQASPADNPAYGQGMYDPVYQQIVSQESPQFIAFGSSFKFGNICPDPPTSSGALVFTDKANGSTNTWQAAQDLTNATQPKNVHARADALIWNVAANAPSWLQTLPDTTTTSAAYKSNLTWVAKYMSAAMKEITQLSNGHADFFYGIGLINEPIVPNFASPQSPSPAYYRDGPWFPTGRQVASFAGVPDYIASAFTSAQSYRSYWATQLNLPATTARFYINETLTETDQFGPVVRPALITLLKAMQAAKLNIQGVGLECHLQPQMMNDAYHPDWTAFGSFIQQIGALGLDVYITELDVFDYETSCGGHAGSAGDSDYLIDIFYDTFLTKVLSYPNVKALTLWDLSDRYSFYRYQDVSTLGGYNTIARPKPANTNWPNCPTLPASATAIACPRPDSYDDTMTPKPARAKIAAALSSAPSR